MMMTSINGILACTTCAQAFKHGGKDAAGWAIMFMLIMILPVITAVVIFIFRMARREKATFDPQYSDNFDN